MLDFYSISVCYNRDRANSHKRTYIVVNDGRVVAATSAVKFMVGWHFTRVQAKTKQYEFHLKKLPTRNFLFCSIHTPQGHLL